MARQFPRFIYSDPQNTKSKGPFCVHLSKPRMVCKVSHLPKIQLDILEIFDPEYTADEIKNVVTDMERFIRSLDANANS